MTNPIAVVRTVVIRMRDDDGNYTDETEPVMKHVVVWCPGCEQAHRLQVELLKPGWTGRLDGQPEPLWQWDGNLEKPTFSPSLLCYYTVHRCEGQHTYTACDQPLAECGHKAHGYFWQGPDGEQRIFRTYEYDQIPEGWAKHTYGGPDGVSPHTEDPSHGNCHSFIRDGVWQFLADSAHHLAGQDVPMEPLPDRFVNSDY